MGGFSLVEALVSLVVLTALLTLALPLVIEALRLLEEGGRRARQQERALALAWMRRDLELGTSVGPCLDVWSEGGLVMHRGGALVEWRVDQGILVRRQVTPGGSPLRRPFLEGMERMRIRCAGRIVEVGLEGRGGSGPAVRALVGGLRPLSAERPWREHLVVATGRAGRRGWW